MPGAVRVQLGVLRLLAATCWLTQLCSQGLAQGSQGLAQDAAEIVRKSLAHDAVNFERVKDYTYLARQEEREFDKSGKVKSAESQTYDISILSGRRYERLVAKNDKQLSSKEQNQEQEKLDRELAKRQKETPAEKARLEKERTGNRRYLQEVSSAFSLTVMGTEVVSGKKTWVIAAEPKPGYKPSLERAKVLTRIRARIWIDQTEYQWVKVDAEAIAPISFEFGLFRIAQGGKLHFEQMRINDEVWLPSVLSASADARVGYLKKVHGDINVTYRDYKKFQTDSRILSADEN
jgi:hypothetical protein